MECLMNGTHDEYKISDIGFQNFYASMLEAKIYIILSLIFYVLLQCRNYFYHAYLEVIFIEQYL